ncbi:uncharacterized protein [Physcomitrium patens]|uniref:Uncharacterized protein n=1 Tax=Physcomitrium patens TaxID=3218 RepID=A0A7I4C1A7_PHYPA|nr:filament-like plant protein 4 isoform X2 [Physcomitrium patens]|eukprot:XP_024357646.1 filament-like plant protein 4 isoform X2 [Physcomitrella patens]
MEKSAERESSRRKSWPWKKKSHDKISAAPALAPSTLTSKSNDNQQIWEYQPTDLPSHTRKTFSMKFSMQQDRNRMVTDEAKAQRLQSEERAETLADKLSNALADITAKDNLVKQHVKVAEEAVSGWEKAEAEAVSLKAQLDAALQKKLATEGRVCHLDGALKECMKQLRNIREENEQRIHDLLLIKSREFDKFRSEMEAELAESSHLLAQNLSELVKSRAEVSALGHALQERSKSIAAIREDKRLAEAEIKAFQVMLETTVKENSQPKHEVHVLNKELDIRSQEREYERKAVDMASKQHLESVKKIAKLEEECNRLRLLVRKKLPGPRAIQRMRMENEGVSKEPADRRRRSMSRSGSQSDLSVASNTMQENELDGRTYEAQMLAERVVAMEEEINMLKEALTQRNAELESARLMSSKATTHLSVVEKELKRAKQKNDASDSASVPPNGFSEFTRKMRGSLSDSPSDSVKARDFEKFELMDDFAEMERLAMSATLTETQSTMPTTPMDLVQNLEDTLKAKIQDLRVADQMYQDLRTRLKETEMELNVLRSRNTKETSMIGLQEQLALFSKRERRRSGSQSTRLSGYSLKDILGRAKRNEDARTTSEASSLEGTMRDEQASISDAESKADSPHLELAIAVRKIFHSVEMLYQATGYSCTPSVMSLPKLITNEISLRYEWRNPGLKTILRNLAHVSNMLLQGQTDFIDFIVEVGTVLDYIVSLKPLGSCTSPIKGEISRESANKDLKFSRDLSVSTNGDVGRLESEKADISTQLEISNEHVGSLKLPQEEDPVLTHKVPQLQILLQQGNDPETPQTKEDDMIEEELMALSSPNPALRAASGELTRLRDRVAGLERELQGERQRNQGIATKTGDVQHQLQRQGNAVSREMSGGSHGDLSSHSTSEEDEDSKPKKLLVNHPMKHEPPKRDTQAAALAECQRTILALGKQLKGIETGYHALEERDTSPKVAHSPRPIEKTTQNVELLLRQSEPTEDVEAPPIDPDKTYNLQTPGVQDQGNQWVSPSPRWAHRGSSPITSRMSNSGVIYSPFMRASDADFYNRGNQKGNGPERERGQHTPRGSSPARSEIHNQEAGSGPGSPARSPAITPWSLRSRLKDAFGVAQGDSVASAEKMRSSSSFSRFYSKSKSGSMS